MHKSESRETGPILEVEHLSIAYETRKRDVEAVRDVSFRVEAGETVGLVGESGCGKSTIAYGIVNFLGPNGKIVEGNVRFQGEELVGRSQEELKKLRGDRIAMVFQDPMQALNPSVRLGEQLSEVLTFHRKISEEEAWEKSLEMLKRVNMPDPGDVMTRYSHQISGGQQQRVVIAMAMLNNPALLIMDEPTTALDATLEIQIIELLRKLQQDSGCSILFVSHHLGLVAEFCDQVVVMYAGETVESGTVRDIFYRAAHPYTKALLECDPARIKTKTRNLPTIPGEIPDLIHLPEQCIFAERCPIKQKGCPLTVPPPSEMASGHIVRCHLRHDGVAA